MAARPLRLVIRYLGAALAVLALVALGFPLAGWLGSSIPRNAGWEEPVAGVKIMLETNGTHTGIVMPVVTPEKDWRETFPTAGQPRADGRMPTHIAVGWGVHEAFTDVPTWADLRPGLALRVLTVGTPSVMRVSHYVHPQPSEYHRSFRISAESYARLVDGIETSLPPPRADNTRTLLPGTTSRDAFYEALGTYTLSRTCNDWVGDMLALAGVKMGAWTPFASGVTKWVEPPETKPGLAALHQLP